MTIHDRIIRRIRGKGRGTVLTARDFLDLGSRGTIDQTLSRLARKGTIRRLDRGVYDYPAVSRRVGFRSPDPYSVAISVADRIGARIQHSGAYSAHVLGLSDQVPGRSVFLTDGPSRIVKAGNQRIELKHTGRRAMIGAGTISGDVQQALRYLGQSGIDRDVIRVLRQRLSDEDKRRLQLDIPDFPMWIQDVVRMVV
ncbi:DUF6088 family protein [Gemmatimonadota bacterium]